MTSKKYNTFREFYEDDDRPKKKSKNVSESQKQKDKFRKQIRFIDPKNIKEDEWDEFEDFDDVK
jgi:hypothetical protein